MSNMNNNFKLIILSLFSFSLFLIGCEKEEKLSSEAEITAFEISSLGSGTISGTNISMSVPYGTDVTNLTPTISVSAGATITPASGLARDFSSTVSYTVTAEDGVTTTVYSVAISVLDPDSVVISSFDVSGAESVDIDQTALTITINILEGNDVSSLTPVITTIPADATVSPDSGSAQDFSSSIEYTVTAGSVSVKYTASVNLIPIGFDAENVVIHFDASAASSTLPAELGASGDNERGFSFNSTHVYVADKGDKVIYYWDHSDSSVPVATLNDGNSVVSGGVFVLADVVATENGIIASNMNWAGGDFKIYRWKDNNADAELMLTFPAWQDGDGTTKIRLGDNINFVGDPQGDGKLYVMPFPGWQSISTSNFVYVWEMVNGAFTDPDNPTRIDFVDLPNVGNYGNVQPVSSGGEDYLLVNGANLPPVLYSADGTTKLTAIAGDAIGNRELGGQVFEFNNARYLVTTLVGSEGSTVRDAGIRVYDITGGEIDDAMNSLIADNISEKLVYSDSYGQNVNGNQAGDVKLFVDNDAVYIFSGAANNGFRVVKAVKNE